MQTMDLRRGLPGHPLGEWGYPFRLPPWATEECLALATGYLLDHAHEAVPFSADRGQHSAVESIVAAGRISRIVAQTMAAEGLPMSFPFLDDQVVDAALRIAPHHKNDPWSFKPLTVRSMSSRVPSEVLRRTTKADVNREVHTGMRKSRSDLAELLTESKLARLGLVDERQVLTELVDQLDPSAHPAMLNETLVTEVWLRNTQEAG